MAPDEKPFIPINEKYNCPSNEQLSEEITKILKGTPSRSETVKALESLPDKEVPELFVQSLEQIDKETQFLKMFALAEIFSILDDPQGDGVEVVNTINKAVKGECNFSGEINLYRDDLGRPYSERMRHLVSRGTFGTTTVEHENGHQRVFSPVKGANNLLTFIESKIDEFKNGESYNQAIELHEVYARLCTVEECCGAVDWAGGPDDIFENFLYGKSTWKPYGVAEDNSESFEKISYAVTSILTAKLFYDEQVIADAIVNHGKWDEETKTYPGLENLIGQIPIDERDYLAQNYRLSAQLERVKAISIARNLVMAKQQSYSN